MESLKTAVRRFLGIADLKADNRQLWNAIQSLRGYSDRMDKTNKVLLSQIASGYKPDLRPEGEIKEESVRLGVQAIERMEAEHLARKHTLGEL